MHIVVQAFIGTSSHNSHPRSSPAQPSPGARLTILIAFCYRLAHAIGGGSRTHSRPSMVTVSLTYSSIIEPQPRHLHSCSLSTQLTILAAWPIKSIG